MTDFQQAVYRAVLDTDDVKLLLQSSEKCPCSSRRSRKKCCYKLNSDGVPVRRMYFTYLAILRKVANHVALLQCKEGTSKQQACVCVCWRSADAIFYQNLFVIPPVLSGGGFIFLGCP